MAQYDTDGTRTAPIVPYGIDVSDAAVEFIVCVLMLPVCQHLVWKSAGLRFGVFRK